MDDQKYGTYGRDKTRRKNAIKRVSLDRGSRREEPEASKAAEAAVMPMPERDSDGESRRRTHKPKGR